MTSQEQQMIQGLIDRVNHTQIAQKDHDAEQLLGQNLSRNPDAIYVLAQTVIVQDYALQQAQRQLAEARQQLEALRQQAQPQQHTSFLGSLLGHKDPPAPPPPRPMPQPPQTYAQPGYGQQTPAAYAPVPGYSPAPSGFGAPASAGGGFLQGAMQTAAGVAAGALAFEGIESLMHGFGHAAGYGASDLGGFGGGGAPREEVVNNYYGDSGDRDSDDRDGGSRQDFDTAAENGSLSPDLEDRRFGNGSDTDVQDGNDAPGFQDAGNSDDFDNGGFDNTADDSGNSDDGGSFDSGGDDGSNFS